MAFLSSLSVNEDEQFLRTFLKMCHRQCKCSVSGQQDGIAAVMARSASVRITCIKDVGMGHQRHRGRGNDQPF